MALGPAVKGTCCHVSTLLTEWDALCRWPSALGPRGPPQQAFVSGEPLPTGEDCGVPWWSVWWPTKDSCQLWNSSATEVFWSFWELSSQDGGVCSAEENQHQPVPGCHWELCDSLPWDCGRSYNNKLWVVSGRNTCFNKNRLGKFSIPWVLEWGGGLQRFGMKSSRDFPGKK